MIDWNNNGKIDPIDVGITVSVLQDTELEKQIPEEKKPSFWDLIKRWLEDRN